MQRWPGEQAVAPPQRQLPADEQLSERASHAAHVDPASPQVASVRAWQTFPAQQPLGHDVASQTHRPETQRWPPAHAGPEPQAQLPPVVQASALVASQAEQSAPPLPQLATDGRLHTPPMQQPFGHELASQMHAPFMQCWPVWQGEPPPQRQAPVTEQVSALSASQLEQAPPLDPQVLIERG
jgi:hypothetical protein